jgi:hypothetical protein
MRVVCAPVRVCMADAISSTCRRHQLINHWAHQSRPPPHSISTGLRGVGRQRQNVTWGLHATLAAVGDHDAAGDGKQQARPALRPGGLGRQGVRARVHHRRQATPQRPARYPPAAQGSRAGGHRRYVGMVVGRSVACTGGGLLRPPLCTSLNNTRCPCCCEGTEAVTKHAARLRLQLAEFAVLDCCSHADVRALLPLLAKQVGLVDTTRVRWCRAAAHPASQGQTAHCVCRCHTAAQLCRPTWCWQHTALRRP